MDHIILNRGSDVDFTAVWGNETPIDLTGFTVDAFEPHPALADHLTLEITDPENGVITGRIEWADEIPTGRVASFRIRVAQGVNDYSTPIIWVDVR